MLEAARPTRLARRPGGKSDPKDALHAARAALATSVVYQPRADGPREALRTLLIVRASAVTARTDAINQLKSLVLQAPDQLRERLRRLPTTALIATCWRLPDPPTPKRQQVLRDPQTALDNAEDRARLTAMRRLAHRIRELSHRSRRR